MTARYAIARPSVCPSHGWISQKRWKLVLCNFTYSSPIPLVLLDKFDSEILTGSLEQWV